MSTTDNEYERGNSRLSALENNVKAIKSVVLAIEGTIGPKGLDCMIVDDYGNSIITNDGITVLSEISATHPAAKLLINAVMAQEREVGDGTTTLAILVGKLLECALRYVEKGIPIHRIIKGINMGINKAIQIIDSEKIHVTDKNCHLLKRVAHISGRQDEAISELIYNAVKAIGFQKLMDKNFKLRECVEAIENCKNEVFMGVIVDKRPISVDMNFEICDAKILILDDELDLKGIKDEILSTEAGFNKYLESVEELRAAAQRIVDLNVNVLLCDRGINPVAEQILLDGGVCIVDRVLNNQLCKVAKHCGCKIIKVTALDKSKEELESYCGVAKRVFFDEENEQIRILFGDGEPTVTIIISASTPEVIRERERIAKDAAASVQFAALDGVVPGGGSVEIYCSFELEKYKNNIIGMEKYGIDCVVEAIRAPFFQMVENSGFNSLEIFETLVEENRKVDKKFLSIDFDTGSIENMVDKEIYDPVAIKKSALKKASEITEAILKINLILKGKNK